MVTVDLKEKPRCSFCDHGESMNLSMNKKPASNHSCSHFHSNGTLHWGIVSHILNVCWTFLLVSIKTLCIIVSLITTLSWRALAFTVPAVRDFLSYTSVKLCNFSSSMDTQWLNSINSPCNPFSILLALEFTLLDKFTFFRISSILMLSPAILTILVRLNQHLAPYIFPGLDTSLKKWFYLRPQDRLPRLIEFTIGLILWNCITLFVGEYGVLNPEILDYMGLDIGSWVISNIGIIGHRGIAAALTVLLANALLGRWILWLNEDDRPKRDRENQTNNGEGVIRSLWCIVVIIDSIVWCITLSTWVRHYRLKGCRLGDYYFAETESCRAT